MGKVPVAINACPSPLVSVPHPDPNPVPKVPSPYCHPLDLANLLWKTLLSLSPPQLDSVCPVARACLGHGTDTLLEAPGPAVPLPRAPLLLSGRVVSAHTALTLLPHHRGDPGCAWFCL